MVHLVLIKDEFRLDLCSELRIDKTTFVSIENGFFFFLWKTTRFLFWFQYSTWIIKCKLNHTYIGFWASSPCKSSFTDEFYWVWDQMSCGFVETALFEDGIKAIIITRLHHKQVDLQDYQKALFKWPSCFGCGIKYNRRW